MPEASEFDEADLVYPPPHPRRPSVLGLLGTILGLGCPPLGLALGVASILYVRRNGGRLVWGVVAIVMSVLTAVISTAVLTLRP